MPLAKSLAGQIQINLYHRAFNVCDAHIASQRPDASKLLLGKTPEQALEIVPLLFALCGSAQSHAALSALQSALGIEVKPEFNQARDMLVQVEIMREHAWRFLLDWPDLTGLNSDKKSLAALLKFEAIFKQSLFDRGDAFKLKSQIKVDTTRILQTINELQEAIDASVFKGKLAELNAAKDEADLKDWLNRSDCLPAQMINALYRQGLAATGQNAVACLPELETQALNRQCLQNGFKNLPQWNGLCHENTALSRQLAKPLIAKLHLRYGNSLMLRILARLTELAEIPSRLKNLMIQAPNGSSPSSGGGIGLAQIQAARGLLIHRLELKQGRVYDDCIVTPTEWNFHPQGVLAQGLKKLKAKDQNNLEQQAKLLIATFDPCLAVNLNIMEYKNA